MRGFLFLLCVCFGHFLDEAVEAGDLPVNGDGGVVFHFSFSTVAFGSYKFAFFMTVIPAYHLSSLVIEAVAGGVFSRQSTLFGASS